MTRSPWPLIPTVVLYGYAGLAGLLLAMAIPQVISPPTCGPWELLCGIQYTIATGALLIGVPTFLAALALQRDWPHAWHAAMVAHAAIAGAAVAIVVPFLGTDDRETLGVALEMGVPFALSVASLVLLWRARELRQLLAWWRERAARDS